MYVSIDLDKMVVAGKHSDHTVLANLDFIHHRSCDLFPLTWTGGLKHRTELELEMLYRNTTGEDSPYHGDELRKVLFALMENLPVTSANKFEVDRQADYIEKKYPKGAPGFVYAAGATVPSMPGDLFAPPHLTGSIAPADAAAAARTPKARPTPANPASTTHAEDSKPARAPGVPRSGGTRELIWKVADELWNKDGSPKDKAQVLAIRRRAMDVLEQDHGVKRTSASSELGNWQKARI